jgi:choline transporter-like protein 2/4/5
LERILKFINKNAYIQCAIFGTPFVESGRQACCLIVRHAARVGSLSYISWAVFLMGKLLISILTTVAAYYTLVEYESQVLEAALYSNGGPIFLIFCISFFMATMFMGVFDTSILTVLHCFAADEEMFQDGSKYTDKDFKKWVDEQEESGRAR